MRRGLRLLENALALPCLILAAAPAFAGLAARNADCGVAATHDAVVITKVTVNGAIVPCMWAPGPPNGRGAHQPAPAFQADDDWLQNTTIELFNRTNKTIVWAAVEISFPQTGDGRSPATAQRTYNIWIGRRPDSANFSFRTGQPMRNDGDPLSFPGGHAMTLNLGDYKEQIQANVREVLFVPVTSIRINPASFIFDDGMRWSPGGHYRTPDPDHPGQWKALPIDYFPGDLLANWPPDRIGSRRR
jgi:hypothetical protein